MVKFHTIRYWEEENISELAYQIAQGDENWHTKSKAIMNAYTGDLD